MGMLMYLSMIWRHLKLSVLVSHQAKLKAIECQPIQQSLRDGRYVAFGSKSRNLIDGQTIYIQQLYVRDLQTGETSIVSKSSAGTIGYNFSPANQVSLSMDGRYIAFDSWANNLHPDDDDSPH